MGVESRGLGRMQAWKRGLGVEIYGGVVQYFTLVKMYGQEREIMEKEEQIMIMLDGLQENEEGQDLLQQLVAEPKTSKKSSLSYDYQPAPIPSQDIEDTETTELKTSNRSTSTCGESEAPLRRCFCTKTRCQKNYCQCFKLGLACTSDCECLACGNKEPLFIGRVTELVIKCKCQKSHCLKKYCECHSSGRRCGPACKCLECENVQERMEEEKPHQGEDIDHFLFFNI